jgi:hypothetical protein
LLADEADIAGRRMVARTFRLAVTVPANAVARRGEVAGCRNAMSWTADDGTPVSNYGSRSCRGPNAPTTGDSDPTPAG